MVSQLCTPVMVGNGVSGMTCICVLGLCSGLLPWLGLANPIQSPEDISRAKDILDPSLLEQSENVGMQELLGDIFSVPNLTDRGAPWAPGPPRPPAPRVEPPEYMLELYKRFANDHTARPTGNTVRSFKNEDSSPTIVTSEGVKRFPLLFNISIPFHERVINAELRLYALVPQDLRCRMQSSEHKVTIFEVHEREELSKERGGSDKRRPEKFPVKREDLISRFITVKESGWEVFELTDAVQRWQESDRPTHHLEVYIDSFPCEANQFRGDDESVDLGMAELDVDRDMAGKHNSVLIVFSDDQTKDQQEEEEEKEDTSEMIDHELDLLGGNELWPDSEAPSDDEFPDDETLMQIRSNMIYDGASRVRRSAGDDFCKKTPLYVEFKDIGYDSWIVAPDGYQANACRGVCQLPFTEDVTVHAKIQALVSHRYPQRVSPPCCVPTKLDPISLLYKDKKGVVTYKHKYENMVVAECGCR